jgi:ABC-2 type transport system permease protein
VLPGITAKTADGASAYLYPLMFLPFVSSAFVPTETMPAAVRWFAENQPVTSIVNTVRALLSAEAVGGDIWMALAWCAVIGAVFWALSVRAYRRKSK